MENAHVLLRLCENDVDRPSDSGDTHEPSSPSRSGVGVGVSRTSATSVRLEHSDMSPGVASISFEQVVDGRDSPAQIFDQSLASAVTRSVRDGSALTVVATGDSLVDKSCSMHGDHRNDVKGVIELAMERVFAVVPEYHEWQVLLAAAYTRNNKVEDTQELVDGFSGESFECDPVEDVSTRDGAFLSRAVRVSNVGEAVQAYRSALEKCTSEEGMHLNPSTDFLCMLFVESRAKSAVIRRSRLCFIDVHGNSIIEPTRLDNQANDVTPSLFAETHFPVNEALSTWCGVFVGNASSTFLVVTIQTSAKKQQQAIQSLLYACKAKEIKSTVTVCEVNDFSVTPSYVELEEVFDEPEDQDGVLTFLGSPVSSPSSVRSTPTRQQTASDVLSQRLREAYQSVKKSSGAKSAVPSPAMLVSNSSDTPVSTSGVSMQTLHARADAILDAAGSKKLNLEAMTLLEKLDRIAAQHQDMEKSFQHEVSVKKKCVERISKLSQTMSFQVVEHEKLLKARDTENQELRTQLQDMHSKYDEAEQTLETLQTQVEAMKVAMRERVSARSPAKASSERLLLQQFSARLETAMLEAKAVVDHKDAVVRELEARVKQLQDAKDSLEKRSSADSCRLREEESRSRAAWQDKEARWVKNKADWEAERQRFTDEARTWRREKACMLEEKTSWEVNRLAEHEKETEWAQKQAKWRQTEGAWIQEKDEWRHKTAELESALKSCREQLRAEQERAKAAVERLALAEQDWFAKESKLKEAIHSARQDAAAQHNPKLALRDTRISELEAHVRTLESKITQAQANMEVLESEKASAHGELEARVRVLESMIKQAQANAEVNESEKATAESKLQDLQVKLEDLRALSAKEKKKLEKKLRILMNERKQQFDEAEKIESEMASEVQRLSLELDVLRSEYAAKVSELEHARQRLSESLEQSGRLEKENSVSKDQITVLQQCHNQLEADKCAIQAELEQLIAEKQALVDELDQRTYALEQRAARELVELEAKLSSDLDRRVRDLMERHSSELFQRDLELRRLRSRRPSPPVPASSPSSSSSSLSSYERLPHQQHDLDQLGVVLDTSGSSARQQLKDKRQDDKISRQKQKIALLRERVESLTHALAVANEQESLAKDAIEQQQALYSRMMYAQDELQTQVNALKEENWSLSLALQVTEKKKRGLDSGRDAIAFLPLSSRIAEC